MPELPEVETVRRSLAPRLVGDVFAAVEVDFPGCVEGMSPEELAERLCGRRVQRLDRMGKYLRFLVDDGSSLAVHLRMTGRLILQDGHALERNPYTRAVFRFASGLALRFDDLRKFGRVMGFGDEASLKRRISLGIDPFDPEFTPERLGGMLSGRKRPVKSFLLDQGHVAGLGNIYADESLFRAGIAPWRAASSLSRDEVSRLHRAIREVLAEGIEHKGTSFRDYVDADGQKGGFQERLRVYGREGMPCPSCGRAVQRIVLSGRSSFFCAGCQG